MSLTNLADVLRSAGLHVVEVDGWQTRWRGAGDYRPGRPTHVMVHHTASNTTAANDVHYMTYTSDIAPIANLYVARDGAVWVMAGGPTNTNGKGHDSWGGGVPDNSMNSYAIGVEIGNNGVGEHYPQAQQDAVMATARALVAAYSIPMGHVRGHFEWAPARKIDPSGPARWSSNQNRKWDMDLFRVDTKPQPLPPPTLPPPVIGDEVIEAISHKDNGYVYLTNGMCKTYVRGQQAMAEVRERYGIPGARQLDPAEFNSYGPILGPKPDGVDDWGAPLGSAQSQDAW